MEIFAMTDSVKVLGFTNFLLDRHDLSHTTNLITTSAALSVSAAISPTDSVAPPIARPSSYRTVPRTLARRRTRTRKRSAADGGGGGGEEDVLFGDGDDGPFGGSGSGPHGSGGGGRGWNFGDFGGNWEDDEDSSSSSSSSYSDPAFDFVYEVISWIALSNCIHFAFKKVVRVIVGDGIGDDASREKVPVRYVPVY
ncbi:hypothetical protein Scep_008974 [Stephania cephalantha]|uniref:Uncharacterized protein n=1 Tax=Stephania cephalantha TaxID=152367 RepID=A0AAP0JTP9_9MAGN